MKIIPKLVSFSTKAMSARQEYKEFLKQKAHDFSKIETEYYHIKEMIKKSQQSRIDLLMKEYQDKTN